MTHITHTLSERFRLSVARSRERREHDRAMLDPRIRDEHFAGRARDVAAGAADCHFCV
jgi:hypothetical protein